MLGERIDALRVPFGGAPARRPSPARLGALGARRRPSVRWPAMLARRRASCSCSRCRCSTSSSASRTTAQLPKSTPGPPGLRRCCARASAPAPTARSWSRSTRRQPGPQRPEEAQQARRPATAASRNSRRSSRRPRSSRPRACRRTRRSSRPSRRSRRRPPTKQQKQASQQETFLKSTGERPAAGEAAEPDRQGERRQGRLAGDARQDGRHGAVFTVIADDRAVRRRDRGPRARTCARR